MKYYSEILKKFYDDLSECEESEKNYLIEQEKKNKEEEEQKLQLSKQKKILADAIEDADKELDYAYTQYDLAKEEVRKIMEDSNKEMKSILDNAKKLVQEAQDKKYKAVANFNEKFGTYKAVYNNDKALKEFNRTYDWLHDLFNFYF